MSDDYPPFKLPLNPHTLDHELVFLAGIGNWTGLNQKRCVNGYLTAIAKRVRGFNGRDLLTDQERTTLRQRAEIMLRTL